MANGNEKIEEIIQFDPDFSPSNEHNRRVAETLRVTYDNSKEVYIDEDGCLIYDRFGQRL